jgi:hypothetical protein
MADTTPLIFLNSFIILNLVGEMGPRTDFFVNSVCCILIAPLLGTMAAGFAMFLIEVVVVNVAGVIGLAASIFFDVDFASFAHRWKAIKDTTFWIFVILGCVVSLIWSFYEIAKHWKSYKKYGKSW